MVPWTRAGDCLSTGLPNRWTEQRSVCGVPGFIAGAVCVCLSVNAVCTCVRAHVSLGALCARVSVDAVRVSVCVCVSVDAMCVCMSMDAVCVRGWVGTVVCLSLILL